MSANRSMSSTEVNSSRLAEREFGPWERRISAGSSMRAPLKNMRERKPFISCMMAMLRPSWL